MNNHEYKVQVKIDGKWEDSEFHGYRVLHDHYQGAYDEVQDMAGWDGDKWVEGIPDGC